MNIIYDLIPEEFIKAIGWTIFHSLWQGAVISILLAGVLLMAGKKSAQLRYNLTVTTLFFMFVISAVTFIQEYNTNSAFNLDTFEPTFISSSDSIVSEQSGITVLKSNEDLIALLKSFFAQHLPSIAAIWFLGFILFSLRFVGGVLYLQRLRNTGVKPVDDYWFYRLKDLSEKFSMNKFVRILESNKVKAPITIGYLKPLIFLPVGMITGLPFEQVDAIIIHELAHIKRHDFLINLFQVFIETVFFYHPAVWWISSTIRNERENCCDDLTLKLCGGSLIYFKALYNLQQICSEENEIALAVIGKKNQLFRRINRMNSNNKMTSYGVKFAAFAVLLIIIAAASVYSTSSAKEKTRVVTASFTSPLTSLAESKIFSAPSGCTTFPVDTTSVKKGKRTFKFSDDNKKYKANLSDGKVEEVYVDGDKVENKDLPKYEGLINRRVDEYDSAMNEFNQSKKEYKEKMKSFSEKMKKFRGNNNFNYNFDFDFDLPPMPDISVNIPDMDTIKFRKMMKEIQKNIHDNLARHSIHIPPIHIPPIHIPDVEWDSTMRHDSFDKEAFKESMKEWSKSFKKEMEKWNIENKGFKEEMGKLKEEMKKIGPNSEAFKKSMAELKVNMDKLKVEMKRLNEFIHAAKDELVKDRLIDEGDDLDDFTLSKDEMIVGGKKVFPELHKKYLELYKKHFGKELTGDNKFRIND